MQHLFITLEECTRASGVVVVIDVIRAFSTASFAFAAGASDITVVEKVEEAISLREQMPGAKIMGEVNGLKPAGFDYGNSPAELSGLDLAGASMIQRTSAGTQGIVRCQHASLVLAASFCCVGATARYLQRYNPERITFVNTGITPQGLGDEDRACAEYLSALLLGQSPDPGEYLERVDRSLNAHTLRSAPYYKARDVELCMELDRFSFALEVNRENGRLVMRPVYL